MEAIPLVKRNVMLTEKSRGTYRYRVRDGLGQ